MILSLLELLKKYNYNINQNNAKYFIKVLYEEQQKEDLLIQKQIKKMLDDINNIKKLEQIERLEKIRKCDIDR